jgi:hypothetical protein
VTSWSYAASLVVTPGDRHDVQLRHPDAINGSGAEMLKPTLGREGMVIEAQRDTVAGFHLRTESVGESGGAGRTGTQCAKNEPRILLRLFDRPD